MEKRYKYKTKWYQKPSGVDFGGELNGCSLIQRGWRIVGILEHGKNKMKVLLEKPETDG